MEITSKFYLFLYIIDIFCEEVFEEDSDNLEKINNSENLAYVIYTSGTTGNPKGVMIEHRSVVNRLLWMQNKYPLNEEDTILQKTTYSFDVSVWELLWWSLVGAKMSILNPNDEKDPVKIIEAINKHKITTIHFVPSMLDIFLYYLEENKKVSDLNSLRQVFSSGETLNFKQVSRFHKVFENSKKLVNLYGPTEATIDVSYFETNSDSDVKVIPIGKPISNINLYILDKNRKLQPVGVLGELYISGDGLARGYLNKPELTSEKFVENSIQEGKKMYKTGDLARWLSDGNIQFLGRLDNQVKIRGFRIEIEEIQKTILSLSDIKDAIVTSKLDNNGQYYLCAYIVCDKKTSVQSIRNKLLMYLPEYMVPAIFQVIEKVPFTINGKVDLKALPEPKLNTELSGNIIKPRDDIEEVILDSWESVLGRKVSSINENFFSLGGDSIKIIQVILKIKNYGYMIEMQDIYQNPTIQGLSPYVKKISKKIDQSLITGSVPLTPIQKKFFDTVKEGNNHFNQSVMIYSRDTLEKECIQAIFIKLIEHHDALRMRFLEENGVIKQINDGLNTKLSLEIFDLKGECDAESKFKGIVNDIQSSINLSEGPLMKLGLFKMNQEDRLLITIHHLVVDGVSWRFLIEDISMLMEQYKKHEKLVLPYKTSSYKLWAEKLIEYSNSDLYEVDKQYWEEFEKSNKSLITKDFDYSDNLQKNVNTINFALDKDATIKLQMEANKAYNTNISDLLISALGVALKTTFKKSNIIIEIEGHGREEIIKDIDIKRTVGWFTSIYPIIFYNSYDDIGMQIKEVKEQLRRIPNKGIGYGINKYLRLRKYESNQDDNTNANICFNYLGEFHEELKSLLRVTQENTGVKISPNSKRLFEIEIEGIIKNQRLEIYISYSAKQYKFQTIEKLAENYKESLQKIIFHCTSKDYFEFTPSDMTYNKISIEDMNYLFKRYNGNIDDIYALSPMQEGIYFHTFVEKDPLLYIIQACYEIQGDININIANRCLKNLVSRHEVLRAAFIHEGINEPLQVILKECDIEINYIDLSSEKYLDIDKKELVEEYKKEDKKNLTTISNGKLIKFSIVKIDKNDYKFIWSLHHLITDGWSYNILIQEFLESYYACLKGNIKSSMVKDGYGEYIQWISCQNKNAAIQYWTNYLNNFNRRSRITNNDIKYTNKKNIYSSVTILIDEKKSNKLNSIAIKYEATLNIIIQAIWSIVLAKYNSTKDIVFGAIVSGRNCEIDGIESSVGLYSNTIPVRVIFEDGMDFSELIIKMHKEAINSSKYHFCRLSEIQACSNFKQDLIDHVISFQNYPVYEEHNYLIDQYDLENEQMLKIINVEVDDQTNYSFDISVEPEKEVRLIMRYNIDIFKDYFIKELCENINKVVNNIIDNETILLSDLFEEISFNSVEMNSIQQYQVLNNDIEAEFNL